MKTSLTVNLPGLTTLMQRASQLAQENFRMKDSPTGAEYIRNRRIRTFVPTASLPRQAAELTRDLPSGMFTLPDIPIENLPCPITSIEYWRAFHEDENNLSSEPRRILPFAVAEGELGKSITLGITDDASQSRTLVSSASSGADRLFGWSFINWPPVQYASPRNHTVFAPGDLPEEIAKLLEAPLLIDAERFFSVRGVDNVQERATVNNFKLELMAQPWPAFFSEEIPGLHWTLSFSLNK